MKKGILLIAVILLSTAGLAQAQADKIGVDVDISWVSKYIWRGVDLLDDKAAFQPSVNFDLYDTGFSFNLWMSYAGGGGNMNHSTTSSRVDATEYDYTVAYACTLFEGESYAANVTANWIYYDFIDTDTKVADKQELGVGFSFPNICPMGITPSYYVGRIWQAKSNSSQSILGNTIGGWVHVFGLNYDLVTSGILPDTAEQVFNLGAAVVYNDSFVVAESDWSHILWSVSTSIEAGPGTFTPSINYQTSMEDTVNTEDEFWAGISYALSF